MSRAKLNSLVEKQIAASTAFWAGKAKLTMEELSAIAAFARKKGKALEEFCASAENQKEIEALLASTKK